MLKNYILARCLITKEEYNTVLNDYLLYNSLDQENKKIIEEEYKQINAEETPHLALKRHGTLPHHNWKEVLIAQNERRERFKKAHPSFCCKGIAYEIESVLTSKRAVIVNNFRKGRESINNVNVIVNNDYFIVIYNRLINSSQTEVVFSGVPLNAINEMDCFAFIKTYIPKAKHNFVIDTSTHEPFGEYLGISEFTSSVLIIKEK